MAKRHKFPVFSFARPTKGLLFIGDPHIWSHKPGRRRDEDYLGTLLGKLMWAAQYANTHDLWPVILGDLLHESNDNDLHMISRLVNILQHFDRKPFVLVGNHDLTDTTLTPGTVLHLLSQTGQIHAMTDNGPMGIITIETHDKPVTLLLGGTPYGMPIPLSLAKWSKSVGNTSHDQVKSDLGVDEVVWITHEDLAFDSSYPGSVALHPIVGADYVVNGHMHATQKPVRKDRTCWYNPGNITRLTIDLMDHIPRVWHWEAGQHLTQPGADGIAVPMITGIDIPHVAGPSILSLEGRAALTQDLDAVSIADTPLIPDASFQFIERLKQDEHIERTDDGVFLQQSIDEEMERLNPPEHIRGIIYHLFEQALDQHRNKK